MFRHLNLSDVFSRNALAMLDLFLGKDGHKMEVGIQLTIHCSPTFPNLLLLSPLQTPKNAICIFFILFVSFSPLGNYRPAHSCGALQLQSWRKLPSSVPVTNTPILTASTCI